MLTGLWTALPPVYDRTDQEIVHAVNRLFTEGVDGLFILGTTGQGADLSVSKRHQILERMVGLTEAPHRIVVAISATPASDVRALMDHACALGIQGVALTPPFYGAFNQDEIQQWAREVFGQVAKTSDVYLYNMPTIGHTVWSVDLVSIVNDIIGVDGVKDSSGDPNQLMDYLGWAANRNASVLVGDERLTTYSYLAGSHGVVSGLSAVHPRLMAELINSCRCQRWDSAIALQKQVNMELRTLSRGSARSSARELVQQMEQTGMFSHDG